MSAESDLLTLQQTLVEETGRILQENLVGIYVHGSLAQGGFRRQFSDFDYLVVVQREPAVQCKRALMDLTVSLERFAPAGGLEMSVVLRSECLCVTTYPPAFVLHYSAMHKARYARDPEAYLAEMKGRDPDLAGYFAVIRQEGITLCGEPVHAVFGEVPAAFVMASFRSNLEDGNGVSAILNRCRFEAYRREGRMLSKLDGGWWALTHFSEEQRVSVRSALCEYGSFEIRSLTENDLSPERFAFFNRHQEVTECWRKEKGVWVLKPIAFVEEWDRSRLGTFCEELKGKIRAGGAMFGAFVADRLIGFANVEHLVFGRSAHYIEMSELHVSCEWRGFGVGRGLFEKICGAARERGAEKLYISAHSSKESQAFYRAVGCREAMEYNARLAAAEPCDCQLEFDLRQGGAEIEHR